MQPTLTPSRSAEAPPVEGVPASGPSRAKTAIRVVMAVVTLVFVGSAAIRLIGDWQGLTSPVDWVLASLSFVALAPFVVGLAYGWVLLLRRMVHGGLPLKPLLAIYALSSLGRYVPGKIGMPVLRATGAGALGVPAAAVTTSVGVELLSWIATAGIAAFSMMTLGGLDEGVAIGTVALALLMCSVVGTVLLVVVPRRLLPSSLLRMLKLEGAGPLVPASLPVVHLVVWASAGVQGALISAAVGATTSEAISAAGFFVLAPVAGFLALAAPAGLAVREAVIVTALTPVVGAGPALAAALIARAGSFAADVIFWLATRRFNKQLLR